MLVCAFEAAEGRRARHMRLTRDQVDYVSQQIVRGLVREQWITGRLLGRVAASTTLVAEIGRSPSSPLTGV